MKKNIRIAAIAAIVAFAAPAIALAAPDKPLPAEASKGKGLKKGHEKGKRGERGERPSFPMEASKFMTHIEKRIERVESRVEKRLERSKMTDAEKNEVRAKVAAGTSKLRSAAQKAAADGTVTEAEAKAVREVAHEMRKNAKGERKEWKKKHGKKGKGKTARRGPAAGADAG